MKRQLPFSDIPGIEDAISFLRRESPAKQWQHSLKARFSGQSRPPADHPFWLESDPADSRHEPSEALPLVARFLLEAHNDEGVGLDQPLEWPQPAASDCLTALQILHLSAANLSAGDPARNLREPGYILIIRNGDPHLIEPLHRAASFIWRSSLRREHIWVQPQADASQAAKAEAERDLTDILKQGHTALVLLDLTTPLPAHLQNFSLAELVPAAVNSDTLAAVLSLTQCDQGPEAARCLSDAELDMLPLDRHLRRLSGLQLGVAFAQKGLPKIIARLSELTTPRVAPSTKQYPQLSDVVGQAEASAFCTALIRDLAQWQQDKLDWNDVNASALLFGPPGTGKSMLPLALANTAGLPFVKTSYAECQQAGHQGQMLKHLMTCFSNAISQAPAVLFVDELDAFYRRDLESASLSGYNVGVVTGLLTEIDRARTTPGLILMAATNHPDKVDPALIRPGRFDLHLSITPLSRSAIAELLSRQLNFAASNQSLPEELLDQLTGATGAAVQSMIRQARSLARAQGTALTRDHLSEVAARDLPRQDPELMKRLAVHEAGHLIVGHLLDCPRPVLARIGPAGGAVIRAVREVHTPSSVKADLACLLAGRVAEELILGGASSGAGTSDQSDLAQATALALQAETSWGFGEHPYALWQPLNGPAALWKLDGATKAAAQKRLHHAADQARGLLAKCRPALQAISEQLFEKRELNAGQIEEMFSRAPLVVGLSEKEGKQCQ